MIHHAACPLNVIERPQGGNKSRRMRCMKNLRKSSSRNSDKFINLKTTNVKVDYISPFERLISHFVNFLFEGNGNLFK